MGPPSDKTADGTHGAAGAPGSRSHIVHAEGSPQVKILRLAWPVVLSMSLHTSYSIVDMFWVSWLGTKAVAAVTLSGLVLWLSFAFSQVFANGAQALVARAWGAGNRAAAGLVVRDSLVGALLTGIVLGAAAFTTAPWLLSLLHAEPAVAKVGGGYLAIMAACFAASMPLFTLHSVFRASGDMMTPLALTSASCLLNIVLDPILIFGIGPVPALGLRGAALASVISMVFALCWGLSAVNRGPDSIRIPLRGRPDFRALRDLFAVGVPSGVHYILLSLTQTVQVRMVASFGTVEVAACGIGARLTQLSFLPCMGIGAATAILVGQLLGAKRPDDAERVVVAALRLNFAVTAVVGLLYGCLPGALLGLFTNDPDVFVFGIFYLRLYAASFIFVSTTIVLTRVFQGAGDTVWPTVAVAGRFLAFIVVAYLLGVWAGMEAIGIWLAMALCSILQTIAIAWLYTLGTWKRRTLASVELSE